jgi:hypothetical protein
VRGIDEIFEAIGELTADVRALNGNVEKLTGIVESLQKTKWTTKGIMLEQKKEAVLKFLICFLHGK